MTVNGSIRLTTTGRALASTVNGSVNATMGRADWPNGASLTSDFPVTVTSSSPGTEGPRRLAGTIGAGGRELEISTVDGSYMGRS